MRNDEKPAFGPSLRGVDQIQETEGHSGRLGGLVLASLGTACAVFAAVALLRRPPTMQPKVVDPLDSLLARSPAASASALAIRNMGAGDVTFPGLLSDDKHPTTALASIPAGSASAVAFQLPPGAPTFPPPAGDRLPVMPMPAQDMIATSPVVTDPKDPLTVLAKERSTIPAGPLAEEGHAGAFVLQVASFRTNAEAQIFDTQLRQRGHKAYIEEAALAGRGTWHRVRVGPFKYLRDAQKYRSEFEAREHIVPFVIEAEKERKLAEAREASLRERAARHRLTPGPLARWRCAHFLFRERRGDYGEGPLRAGPSDPYGAKGDLSGPLWTPQLKAWHRGGLALGLAQGALRVQTGTLGSRSDREPR